MMKKAIITIGVSASGKSTWAREYCSENPSAIEINRDNIRALIFSEKTKKSFSWNEWKWKWEDEVTKLQREMIERAANDPKINTIIISDTNLNKSRNENLKARLESLGFEVEFRVFEVSYEEAVKRDAARANGVGAHVIAKQFQDFHALMETAIKQDESLPKAILVDIDGTLSHMNYNRGPFDWDRVDEDDVDEFIKETVNLLASRYKVIVLSGRDSICRGKTQSWLRAKGIHHDGLLMRAEGDKRSDDIVKREIVENYVLPYYYVVAVFDDRPKVCRMWRKIGLKTLQVGDPHVEF